MPVTEAIVGATGCPYPNATPKMAMKNINITKVLLHPVVVFMKVMTIHPANRHVCQARTIRDFPFGFLPTTGVDSFLKFWSFSSCFIKLQAIFPVHHRFFTARAVVSRPFWAAMLFFSRM
jgi:hypothetical protein